MPLTQSEREWIALKARDTAFAVCEKVLEEHTKLCPHGKALFASKWFILGIFAASGLVGGSGVMALLKILPGM